jgi:hypothetical protein
MAVIELGQAVAQRMGKGSVNQQGILPIDCLCKVSRPSGQTDAATRSI